MEQNKLKIHLFLKEIFQLSFPSSTVGDGCFVITPSLLLKTFWSDFYQLRNRSSPKGLSLGRLGGCQRRAGSCSTSWDMLRVALICACLETASPLCCGGTGWLLSDQVMCVVGSGHGVVIFPQYQGSSKEKSPCPHSGVEGARRHRAALCRRHLC